MNVKILYVRKEYNMRDEIDPDNISKSKMNQLADQFDEYLTVLKEIMIIPEHDEKMKKKMKKGIEITEKLIKKLRKGDKSVFKTADEWQYID